MAVPRTAKPLLGSASFGDSIAQGFSGQLRNGTLYDEASPGSKTYAKNPDGTTDYTKPEKAPATAYPFQGIAKSMDSRWSVMEVAFDMQSMSQAKGEKEITIVLCDAVPEIGDRIVMDDFDGKITAILSSAPDDSLFKVISS